MTASLDAERCYRAVASRDARFDGWFVTAVRTTGIYCRPSCPARTPAAANVCFFGTAAGAHAAGFRACRRCRPDAVPGSPEWDVRADAVARAMRLIADGEVERTGVPGLAARLGYSERQVHRLLVGELGVGPLAVARAQRAQTARVLIETTDLPMADVAFAAGFASVRQFNDTIREVFACTPSELRRRRPGGDGGTPGWLTLRLAARAPFDAAEVLHFLGAHAVPGLEEWDGTTFSRVLDLPAGPGVVRLSPAADGGPAVTAQLLLADLRDLRAAVPRCRRLLDLDADPLAVDDVLGDDPALAPLVAGAPGRRVPASPDAPETAARAVLGQQVSVAGARTLTARVVALAGTPLPEPVGTLTHAFPRPAALAEADLSAVGLTGARRRTLTGLAAALADGRVALDPGCDREQAAADLLALPGIGPWTASLVVMRGLGDPDVWLPGDLALRRSLAALGSSDADAATRWRPWRSYAAVHLWALAAPTLFTRSPASDRSAS
ncbi:AraC family transcriptional regulator of adaptative response / DNA-3-methyladenine glycosylase II [Geodermatophilus bullaregiensis]|uniref:AlkA N-terminal domain-containing protein n=1 Tax=Geodermatophilus bullaregiensis TaxID=1564160 RepID=UPI0027DE267B|nr:AlkA N-terminal domain-containing protein [Geodermatophilus bullaregiensis]MBM7807488.1 AraC family transcriptional regulator of adaptative response / DNA-3-methyladenine glycosylase II [Geodermatophilus bullaregiensis]